jgi:hypothetical protein
MGTCKNLFRGSEAREHGIWLPARLYSEAREHDIWLPARVCSEAQRLENMVYGYLQDYIQRLKG